MSTLGLFETASLCKKKADSLNLTASSRRFSVFELRWDISSEAFKERFRVVFVSHRRHAVTGILQSEPFSQSWSSWKQREEKRDSLYNMIKIAKETTVHILIIECTNIKINHSDRQYCHKSQERQDIWEQIKQENALNLF